jgi:hemerythrin superfamily protein
MTEDKNSARDLAVLIGGIAVGILGSRLLPPLVASASGMRRARAGNDPFELLIEDHRQILSTLDEMVAASADSTLQRSRMFLRLKRKLGKHALAEEDVVYPLLHTQAQQGGESKHLYDEHADMKILLFQLEGLLKTGEDWSEPARSLRDLIRGHVEEEEHSVFPQLRRSFQEDQAPKISGQIRREEAMIL